MSSNLKQLAFVEALSIESPHTFSGTSRHIANSLVQDQARAVNRCDRLRYQQGPQIYLRRLLYNKLLKKRRGDYFFDTEPSVLRQQFSRVSEKLKANDQAILVTQAHMAAYMQTELPIILYTDANYVSLFDFYYHRRAEVSKRNAMNAERRGFSRLARACFSSEWARRIAIEKHAYPEERTCVIPFGTNLENEPNESDITSLIESRPQKPVRFLFVGYEWERKGGDIVIQVLEKLQRDYHLPVRLDVLGPSASQIGPVPEFVQLHGKIDRSSPAGDDKYRSFLQANDFYFMPSRAECTPMSISEAARYGLPSISSRAGGIPSMVQDNVTGLLANLDCSPDTYAQRIHDLINHPDRYRAMARAAFNFAAKNFSWANSTGRLVEEIESLL